MLQDLEALVPEKKEADPPGTSVIHASVQNPGSNPSLPVRAISRRLSVCYHETQGRDQSVKMAALRLELPAYSCARHNQIPAAPADQAEQTGGLWPGLEAETDRSDIKERS